MMLFKWLIGLALIVINVQGKITLHDGSIKLINYDFAYTHYTYDETSTVLYLQFKSDVECQIREDIENSKQATIALIYFADYIEANCQNFEPLVLDVEIKYDFSVLIFVSQNPSFDTPHYGLIDLRLEIGQFAVSELQGNFSLTLVSTATAENLTRQPDVEITITNDKDPVSVFVETSTFFGIWIWYLVFWGLLSCYGVFAIAAHFCEDKKIYCNFRILTLCFLLLASLFMTIEVGFDLNRSTGTFNIVFYIVWIWTGTLFSFIAFLMMIRTWGGIINTDNLDPSKLYKIFRGYWIWLAISFPVPVIVRLFLLINPNLTANLNFTDIFFITTMAINLAGFPIFIYVTSQLAQLLRSTSPRLSYLQVSFSSWLSLFGFFCLLAGLLVSSLLGLDPHVKALNAYKVSTILLYVAPFFMQISVYLFFFLSSKKRVRSRLLSQELQEPLVYDKFRDADD